MDWYYANERDEQIQVSEEEMKALAEGGTIRPDTLVWNESLPDWKPCRELRPEWFSPAELSAPAPVPASGPISPANPTTASVGDSATTATTPSMGTAIATTSPAVQPPVNQPPPHYRTAPPTDGLALASLICSISGLAFMGCYGAGAPFSIAGIICGHLCRSRLVAQGNTTSAGLALAGLIIGYVGVSLIAFFVLALVGLFGFAAATAPTVSPTIP